MHKILSVVDTAYRATLEEQDDTSLWFNHACRNAGANISLLLTGNAVNYAVAQQKPRSLNFGTSSIPHPSKFHEDLLSFKQAGGQVFYMEDDAEERGIGYEQLVEGIEPVKRSQMASLMNDFDLIWHW
ncbi:MAG: DsrE family protein [Oligoflexales bacterium]